MVSGGGVRSGVELGWSGGAASRVESTIQSDSRLMGWKWPRDIDSEMKMGLESTIPFHGPPHRHGSEIQLNSA
jgi:hypothetical protein